MKQRKKHIGWREWVSLPELGVARIKAKIDTGARTSALHVSRVEQFSERGRKMVRFLVHPRQGSNKLELEAVAPLAEHRTVKSSSGHASRRPVVITKLMLGSVEAPIELTLVNRDVMGFRMLIGRQAIRSRCVVDPGRSYLLNRKKKRQ